MNRHPWINKYGTVAVFLMILLVMNPELREFLIVANLIGLDLIIFFIATQLRDLLAASPSMRRFMCVASYTTLRVAARMIALLLASTRRVSTGATTLPFVVSTNLWCPKLKQDLKQFDQGPGVVHRSGTWNLNWR